MEANCYRIWKNLEFPALYGKHVVIRHPSGSGSYFCNYKDTFHCFDGSLRCQLQIHLCGQRHQWKNSDGGVYNKSSLARALEENAMGIPKAEECAGFSKKKLPYIMKPFPRFSLTPAYRMCNYRLSRARRVIENIFSIMAFKFRILLQPINSDITKIEEIVWICCAHNLLRFTSGNNSETDKKDENGNAIPGSWREKAIPRGNFVPLSRARGRRQQSAAKSVREDFVRYFNGCGAIPWQEKYDRK